MLSGATFRVISGARVPDASAMTLVYTRPPRFNSPKTGTFPQAVKIQGRGVVMNPHQPRRRARRGACHKMLHEMVLLIAGKSPLSHQSQNTPNGSYLGQPLVFYAITMAHRLTLQSPSYLFDFFFVGFRILHFDGFPCAQIPDVIDDLSELRPGDFARRILLLR